MSLATLSNAHPMEVVYYKELVNEPINVSIDLSDCVGIHYLCASRTVSGNPSWLTVDGDTTFANYARHLCISSYDVNDNTDVASGMHNNFPAPLISGNLPYYQVSGVYLKYTGAFMSQVSQQGSVLSDPVMYDCIDSTRYIGTGNKGRIVATSLSQNITGMVRICKLY